MLDVDAIIYRYALYGIFMAFLLSAMAYGVSQECISQHNACLNTARQLELLTRHKPPTHLHAGTGSPWIKQQFDVQT